MSWFTAEKHPSIFFEFFNRIGRRLPPTWARRGSAYVNSDARSSIISGDKQPITDIQDELTHCSRLSLLALRGTPASRR